MGKSRHFGLALAAAGTLSLAATIASAGQINLYERPGLEGRSIATTSALPNLRDSAFNDVAFSATVLSGAWEACNEPYFRGTCARLVPGDYRNVDTPLHGAVASVRPIEAPPVTGAAPVVVTPAPVLVQSAPRPVVVAPAPIATLNEPRIVLYQHTTAGIRAVELNVGIDDLASRSFAASADAALVMGGPWRLCDGARGTGQCLEYSPGQYVTLGSLDRRVMSAYPMTGAPQRAADAAPAAAVASAGRLVLYENPNFSGPRAVVEHGRAPDLDWANFKNPAASFRVESGTWLVCSDLAYQGDCRVVGPGDYAMLPAGMTGIVSAHQV